MLPSVVASEVASAIRAFVESQFLPSNRRMTTVIQEFLRQGENLLKGPYLSLSLPFQTDSEPGEAFPQVPLGFVPFRHQRSAFDRLGRSQSTVIATGTGSGKTECFLLPILDSCRKHAGEPGIKAILIYPMNALANDQARRIAEKIHGTPALRGRVTAGIWIGQDRPSRRDRMTGSHILGDRDVIVERPPDILLTNYKMLDYLLSRPRDQRLWRHNAPGTLRWLVVDELHTFDGAQGTDLACLIRRLKARLGTGGEGLTCVGTSATLGTTEEGDLLDYVRQVFGEHFTDDSIVGESRQSVDQFLGESPVEHQMKLGPDVARAADRSVPETADAYLCQQFQIFFGKSANGSISSQAWRSELGELLRRHAIFHRLLRVLEQGPKSIGEIADALMPALPCKGRSDATALVNGLFALVSHARSKNPEGPFLDVSAQLWVREMGRMVCSISEDVPVKDPSGNDSAGGLDRDRGSGPTSGLPETADTQRKAGYRRLRYSDDLETSEGPLHLPVIQCRTCRVTGWGAVVRPGGSSLGRDLRHFYNQFFDHDPDVRFLFPVGPPRGTKGASMVVCGSCGHFGPAADTCDTCGPDYIVEVFVPDQTVDARLSEDCPFCAARNGLSILGARSTVLVSAALAQVYASHYNDDIKVIAFSDNVQDAAHRAAFTGHRTWRTGKRAILAQAVPEGAALPLSEFPAAVVERARNLMGSGNGPTRQEFVDRFIAPDRTWLKEFQRLEDKGRLGGKSSLPALVRRRLEWEAFSEAGFAGRRPDSLQRARVAAVGPDLNALQEACKSAAGPLREEIGGLEHLSLNEVRWIALGILRRMLHRGAIDSNQVEAVKRFLERGCTSASLHQNLALPDYGYSYSPVVFPREIGLHSGANGTEPLVRAPIRSWYQQWVDKVLVREHALLPQGYQAQVLQTLLKHLFASGLVALRRSGKTVVWALSPDRFRIGRNVRVVRCSNTARDLVVPRDEAALWLGAPCLELAVQDSYTSHTAEGPTWAGQVYRGGAIRRVWAAEHTALLSRRKRDRLQARFAAPERAPLDPNLLSATPTLEMGIDIGDLSTVVLCSVPPTQANYLQRVGRAGRRDGNSLTITVAAARAHDLSFFASPLEMIHGSVTTPGVFLNASAVLERQLTSFCLDDWAASCGDPAAVPRSIGQVLAAVRRRDKTAFPYTLFSHINRYRDALFHGFREVFGEALNADSKRYLRKFLFGEQGTAPQLEEKILNRLKDALDEQDAFRRDVRTLRRRLDRLDKGPVDEATQIDRQEVALERNGLGMLSRSLRNRDTFGFLTDSGLIPNYAFPEEGVTLRSVIVRNVPQTGTGQAAQGGPPEQDSEAFRYMRPASAALSELAPDNRFYAEGHRVTIDRINMTRSSIEQWRLCPSCTHLERVDQSDQFGACPRCGDPMWADSGQVRRMIPLRMVHASTGIRRAQIRDDLETRDPLFYTRHLVAEPEQQATRKAFGVASRSQRAAFGFEYVSATTFREMNFGPITRKGQLSQFDGKKMPRIGFRICRKCGRVQSRRPGEKPRHYWTCRRGLEKVYQSLPDTSGFGDDVGPVARDPDIVDCLYLYREFSSESLSILVPGVYEDATSPRVQAFIAAVELGLKRKFRGKVDHIRAMVQRKLDADQTARRNLLILYDSVPGGTGYLKELANTPTGLVEVFRTALEHIEACKCEDGCHRCLRAFRSGPDLPSPSKSEAITFLGRILECADGLQPIESIDGIEPDSPLESDLEARFLSALRRRGSAGGRMVLRSAAVRGRRGWALTIGKRTWTIAPQIDLGAEEDVVHASRPDFVFYPPPGLPEAAAVAVFLDGFEYHQERTGEDSVKRMALIRAGFLQWSLTWHDLDSAFGRPSSILDLLRGSIRARESGAALTAVQHILDEKWASGPLRRDIRRQDSSFDLLLRYLEEPDLEQWRRAVFTEALCLFDQSRMSSPEFRQQFLSVARDILPNAAFKALSSQDGQFLLAGGGPEFDSGVENATLLISMPPSAIGEFKPEEMSFALHLNDLQPEASGYRDCWNGALRLFNLIQFLSEAWWTTASAIAGGYPDLAPVPQNQPMPEREWALVTEEADESVHDLIREVAELGVRPPDVVGFELTNAAGVVVAEAELAWTGCQVALLREDQQAERQAIEEAGWAALDQHATAEGVRQAVHSSAG